MKAWWNTEVVTDLKDDEIAKLKAEIAELTATCSECKEPVLCPVKAELKRKDAEIERLKNLLKPKHPEWETPEIHVYVGKDLDISTKYGDKK